MDKHLDVLKSCCPLCGKKLVKGARKTRVSILTSVCQAEVDAGGTLQKREGLAPR